MPPGTQFTWSTGATGNVATNLAPGTYCVTVTNTSQACTASTCVQVLAGIPLVLTGTTIQPNCNNQTGVIQCATSGGVPPYTYSWSSPNMNGPVVQGLFPGVYIVTVTDASGCTATQTFQLNSFLQVTPIITVANCIGTIQLIHSAPTPGTANPVFTWSNGATGPIQTGLSPGVYSVIAQIGSCTKTIGPLVVPADGCERLLEGKLRRDDNDNCLPEPTEIGLGGWIIRATETTTNTEFFSLTSPDGYYYMGLPNGNYLVQARPLSPGWAACGTGSLVSFSGPDTIQIDISAKNLINCPILNVDITSGLMRRCFSGNRYVVKTCNIGTVTATNPHVDVSLDVFQNFESSTLPSLALPGNTRRFQLPDLAPGACISFDILFQLSCNAALGQTHCAEAHAYPDTLCFPPNPSWNGAAIIAESRCIGDSLRFIIKNVGNSTMSNDLEYIVIEDAIMMMQGQSPPLVAGDSMIVTVPANGSTWRLEVEQEPFHPAFSGVAITSEGCVSNANQPFSTGFFQMFPLMDSMPWFDKDCRANQGAYDPNDKAGIPLGYSNLHYIEPGTPIEYTIRFQNTGTDTAFTVIVADTLSQLLDPATFQLMGTSHTVRTELYGEGIVRFTFNQIMLPDSFVNEPLSHGFIKYRISPRPGLPLETDVFNEASIYFDYNDPIVTNRTQHRLGQNFVVVRLFEPDHTLFVAVQPNPVTDRLLIKWAEFTAYRLQVIDMSGRVVAEQEGSGSETSLYASAWKSGYYLIRMIDQNGKTHIAKVVKEE